LARLFAPAEAAERAEDWAAALAIWSSLAERFPEAAAPAVGRGVALLQTQQLADAEAALADAASRFPELPRPLMYHALTALRRGDWDAVLRRAMVLRERFPKLVEGHLGIGEALRQLARFDEAEGILAAAAARFPSSLPLRAHHALVAVSRQDWPEALRRWQAVCARFPRQPDGYIGGAEAALALGKPAQADAILRQAAARVAAPASARRLAAMAARLQLWPAAATLWRTVEKSCPDDPDGFLQEADALQRSGRLAEADRVLLQATQLLPACEAVWLAALRSALSRQDQPEALRRWRRFVECCPASAGERLLERQELRKQLAVAAHRLDAEAVATQTWIPGTVICEDPVIIILCQGPYLEALDQLAPFYRDRPVYFFVGMLWTVAHDANCGRLLKEKYTAVTDRNPNFRVMLLANDVAELLAVRELGLPAELVNHNAFIDDIIFDILPVEQNFDAIYNARMADYKRHSLAKDIARLKLIITGATPEIVKGAEDLLPGCTVANRQGAGLVHLGSREVAYHLNTAKCGLCLSPLEGAMFASAEYLLCGLPVVTTHNVGGRNWFFANDYVIFCDDNAAAVAAAVAQITRANIPRRLIRESAREKIRRDRLVFFALVDRVFHDRGQQARRIEPEFAQRFCDKINYIGRPVSELVVP
jgi:tetratricopeptide (TPR) repeat protein